jgi:hypothetical protein
MAKTTRASQRQEKCQQVLVQWAQEHKIDLAKLDSGQQWVIYAALQALMIVGTVAPLRRVVGYLLSHCGMDLSAPVIAAVMKITDRAVRKTKALSGKELLSALRRGGNRRPKLRPEHAGVVAKFLVEHPDAPQNQMLAFVLEHLHLSVDRQTLGRFLTRYGLGCLCGSVVKDAPLLSAPRSSEVPSSCSDPP